MADNQGSFVLKSPPKASPETFKLPTSELDSMSMDKPRLPRTIFRCASRIVPDARQKKLCIGRSFFRGDKQPGEVSFAERERKVEALGLQLACIKMNVTADKLMFSYLPESTRLIYLCQCNVSYRFSKGIGAWKRIWQHQVVTAINEGPVILYAEV
ncbi:hypothetical protein ABG067_000829 [Albugo candida]